LDMTDEDKKFKQIAEKVMLMLKNYYSLFKVVTKVKNKNRTKKIFSDWKEKLRMLLKEYRDLRSEVYSTQSVRVLANICKMTQDHRGRVYDACKNCERPMANFFLSKFRRLLDDDCYLKIIKKMLPSELLKRADNEQIDYNSICIDQMKCLEACLVVLDKLQYFEQEIKELKIYEKVKLAEEFYHKAQYTEYWEDYKKWLIYGVNSYKSLKESLIEIEKYENNVTTNISNCEEQNANISYKKDINDVKKQITILKRKEESAYEAESMARNLLERVKHNFSELNRLRLEMISLTKKSVPLVAHNINLSDCLETWRSRLNFLAEDAHIKIVEVSATDFPNDLELDAIQKKLNDFFINAKKYCDNASRIKKKIINRYDEVSRLAEIYEKETFEHHALTKEFNKEEKAFKQLHNSFMCMFDLECVDGDKLILSKFLEKVKNERVELKKLASSSLLETLKSKARKIIFLQSCLSEYDKTLQYSLVIENIDIEDYDKKYTEWSNRICAYLNNHIELLLDDSRKILTDLDSFNSNKKEIPINLNGEIEILFNSNNDLILKYDNLMDLISSYENFGAMPSFNKFKMYKISEALFVNEETIASIKNVLMQEMSHITKKTVSKGMIYVPPDTLLEKKAEPLRKASEKYHKKNDILLVKDYEKKFKNFSDEMGKISREILTLNLEVSRSENTIKTLLPRILPSHGREGLAMELEKKISKLADKIRSYGNTINQIRSEGAKLVSLALDKLTPSFNLELKSEIEHIKSMIQSDDCSDLSLKLTGVKEYILSIDTKYGQRFSFSIGVNLGASQKDFRILFVAIKGQSRLLDSNWYANQTNFIIGKIDEFLNSFSINNSIRRAKISEDPIYAELLGSIINATQQAKKNIQSFDTSKHDILSLEERSQQYNELQHTLIDLDTSLGLFINVFNKQLWLAYDLKKYNVLEIRAMLINIIHERIQTFHSIIASASSSQYKCQTDILSPNPLALVPYTQNPFCFFEPSVNSRPVYFTISTPVSSISGQLFNF